MFYLTEAQLDNAASAIQIHGHGDFFPNPPEIATIQASWAEIRTELSRIDLDTYTGYDLCQMFAPKSRLNIRRVTQLHPYDLIFFTALVLELRDSITSSRLPPAANKVFSYRADGVAQDTLYAKNPNYRDFRKRVRELAEKRESFLGITDIGDFFSRIYHHRLVNALLSASGNSKRDEIRCLEKILYRFADGASYGIPTGPPASRVLAEAVLIDVDSTLVMREIDFVRYVDDYIIFADRIEEVEYGIRELAEVLYLNHGLALQTAKTRIVTSHDYLASSEEYEQKEAARRELIDITGGYEDEITGYEDLDDDEKRQIDALNLSGMLEDALSGAEQIDFQEVSFILSRLSSLREPNLIPIVLANLEKLFPVAHAVARFFSAFDQLQQETKDEVTNRLLAPIEAGQHVSEYYTVWILSLFFEKREWDHATRLARIFVESQSDATRRFAALALSSSGTRAEALTVMRSFRGSVALVRTTLLLVSTNLGMDERKYTMKSLQLRDQLERTLAR